jgi:Leucine-rich repeat (LRR) protein
MEVGHLKNVLELDISENNLFGEIPTAIGDCLSLQNIYLQVIHSKETYLHLWLP